jgi:hypothetical protein
MQMTTALLIFGRIYVKKEYLEEYLEEYNKIKIDQGV